jgi:Na+/proline symporter
MPYGYTLPQWIRFKLQDDRVHKLYLFPFFFYQLMSITVQLYAGGNVLALLLGIPVYQATAVVTIAILGAIPLIYTLVSGFESSIITDFLQLLFIIVALVILIPWTVSVAGVDSIRAGLAGLSGSKNIFDPAIAFSLGIVTSIGLIAGAVSDQQYWQRGFAIRKGDLRKAFIFGALAFGLVPILLGILGFVGADPQFAATVPQGVDASLIGVVVVSRLLPLWTVFFFVVMLLCALSSTLDSGMNAAASLYATDIMKYTEEEHALMLRHEKGESLSDAEKLTKHLLDARRLAGSRATMVWLTIVGFLVALAVIYIPHFGLQQLWWVFNTVAACVMVPTILSLYWERLSTRGVFWGVLIAFFVGLPLFIYSNYTEKPVWIVGSALFVVGVTLAFCLALPKKVVVA